MDGEISNRFTLNGDCKEALNRSSTFTKYFEYILCY